VVVGNYDDGSQRDLTGAETGTTYDSDDPAIATVDENGQVSAVGNGTTTIAVTNGTETATVVVLVQMPTDLSVVQDPVTESVDPGAELAYRLIITNLGAETAREVQVEDRLAQGSSYVSASGSGWSCIEAGGVVSCYRPELGGGASAPIDILTQAPTQAGPTSNTAAVRSGVEDGNTGDNVAVQSFQVGETDNADVDGNGAADALSDGLLIIRRLFGFSGAALTDGAVGSGCTRCDPTAIAAHIDQIQEGLDVDGNGLTDALTDGLLIIRYLFGFSGTALTDGAVGAGCTRCTAEEISAYCATLVP